MKYKRVVQLPNCCVLACVTMILHRHGFTHINQEYIGQWLSRNVPREDVHDAPPKGWVMRAGKEDIYLNSFFTDVKLPFTIKKHFVTSTPGLKQFLAKNKCQDIIVCFDPSVLYKVQQEPGGHVCVVESFDEGSVVLVDPSEKYVALHGGRTPITVAMNDLVEAFENYGEVNGAGLWLITNGRRK